VLLLLMLLLLLMMMGMVVDYHGASLHLVDDLSSVAECLSAARRSHTPSAPSRPGMTRPSSAGAGPRRRQRGNSLATLGVDPLRRNGA
jgi:hypothetical protein